MSNQFNLTLIKLALVELKRNQGYCVSKLKAHAISYVADLDLDDISIKRAILKELNLYITTQLK